MNKDYLISTIEVDCPICNKVHSLEKRKRITQSIVKDEIVDYEEVYFSCLLSNEDENEFVPSGLMDENLMRMVYENPMFALEGMGSVTVDVQKVVKMN